ncbi:MAG: glycosyltransferase family 39 protein [Chloroflexi bacterium]|nr:glycosyltransferase family 39 protein [Chloroflexota bacterium]
MKEISGLEQTGRISRFIQNYSWLIVSALLLTGVIGVFNRSNGGTNLYAYQAEAFLHGNFAIQEKPAKLPGETLQYKGRIYSPFPPFPAVILTPFVALFGRDDIKMYWISFAIAMSTCFILYRILLKLELDKSVVAWVLAGFALGTGYWQVFRASDWVWLFAQLTAVLCAVLAIHEAMHNNRGWLAGLFVGLAFLSRQLSIYMVVFIPVLLWKNSGRPSRLANIIGFLGGVGVCILLYLGFNYYRFDSFGTGYEALNYETYGGPGNFLAARVSQYGIFAPAYFIFNIAYMFIQGYHIEFGGANMLDFAGIDRFGTSLLAASPFIIAAFRAKADRLTLWSAWVAVLLSLVHALFYHNNGYIQYNMQRFSMDFMPIFILLVAMGIKNSSPDLRAYWKGMIVYSIFLNVITNFLPFS